MDANQNVGNREVKVSAKTLPIVVGLLVELPLPNQAEPGNAPTEESDKNIVTITKAGSRKLSGCLDCWSMQQVDGLSPREGYVVAAPCCAGMAHRAVDEVGTGRDLTSQSGLRGCSIQGSCQLQ